jgi:hypothetical protein
MQWSSDRPTVPGWYWYKCESFTTIMRIRLPDSCLRVELLRTKAKERE